MQEPSRRNVLALLSSVSVGTAVLRPDRLFAQSPSLQDVTGAILPVPRATIFVGREIITMDTALPRASAVAVVNGRIAAVGSLDELQAMAGDQPFEVDETFRDKVIIAGFIEQHVHPILAAITMRSVVISIEPWDSMNGFSDQVRDEAGYLARLKEAMAPHDKSQPFVTWGYHHYFHGPMNRTLLDQLAPDFPVIVWHRSAHEFFLNTRTIEQYGIDDAWIATLSEAEARQSDLVKGHFFEAAYIRTLEPLAPALASPKLFREGLEFTVGYYHRNGITMCCEPGGLPIKRIQDAVNAVYSPDATPFNHYFIADGKFFSEAEPDDPVAMIKAAESVLGFGEGRTKFLPKQIKFLLDGAIFSQLMQMTDGYTDGHEGEWIMTPERFQYAFQNFWDADYQIHVHNNGDLGMNVLLDNVEQALRRTPRFDHRTTIVHFGFATPEQVTRAGRMGCIVSANPYYVTALAGRYAEVGLGPDRAARMVPLADAKAAGMSISLHSDMPMAPAKPMQLVWSAVNRITAEGEVAGPSQRIDLETALKGITIDAAYSIRLEDEIGSITPGKFANFTILEQSPYDVPVADLAGIKVWGTVLEGRVQPVVDAATTRAELRPLYLPKSHVPHHMLALGGGHGHNSGHGHLAGAACTACGAHQHVGPCDACGTVKTALSAVILKGLESEEGAPA